MLEQRKNARDPKIFLRCLARSPRAEASDRQRDARRLHPHHHGRNMVALSALYASEAVSRAMEEAVVSEAFSSDSIANLVEQRARCTPEASALPLPRRADRRDVSLAPPARRMYDATPQPGASDTEEGPPHG